MTDHLQQNTTEQNTVEISLYDLLDQLGDVEGVATKYLEFAERGNVVGVRVIHTLALEAKKSGLAIDLNALSENEYTPLHRAAANGYTDVVRAMIAAKKDGLDIDLHAKDVTGNTPLHFAAKNGHTDVAKAMIAANNDGFLVDLNAKNEFGNTPLHAAVSTGCVGVVEAMIAAKKDGFDIDLFLRNNLGLTPYDLANENGNSAVCRLYKLYERSLNDRAVKVNPDDLRQLFGERADALLKTKLPEPCEPVGKDAVVKEASRLKT